MKLKLLVFGLVLSAFANGVSEIIPIQERAQGQSLTGANLLNDSLYSNPGASAFTQVYCLDGMVVLPKGIAVSVLDSKTSGLGGGIGYFRRSLGDYEQPLQGVKLSLFSQVNGFIGFGIGGKALWGPSPDPGLSAALKDLDSGILFNLRLLQLGISVRNILGGEAAVEQQREVSYGGRINYMEALFLSASALSRQGLTPYQYGIGVEYLSPYYFALKGGYRFQPQAGTSFWSGGASLVAPRLSLHYAFEIPNQGSSQLQHVLGASLMM